MPTGNGGISSISYNLIVPHSFAVFRKGGKTETLKTVTKTYKKIIVSGNIIEFYEAEKEPYIPEKNLNPDDGYDALDIPIDSDDTRDRNMENHQRWLEDREEERRRQTIRDARNATRRLALMNFGNGDKFLTLTFRENVQDIFYADKEFEKFIKRFKRRFKIEKLKYVAVREFQKRGAIHYHLICDWKKDFTCEEQIKEFERFIGEKVWKHGFVDIKQMVHVDNVGAYLIKYMTKSVAVEFFKGRKIYLCSQGLKRPLIYRGLEAEAILQAYGLENKKEVFTNSYESEYLGQITYKEYNLKRI